MQRSELAHIKKQLGEDTMQEEENLKGKTINRLRKIREKNLYVKPRSETYTKGEIQRAKRMVSG